MRVLVIEDEAKMTALLRRGLDENGARVSIAEDGERGLSMAESDSYDAVILDVTLPGIDGFETARGTFDDRVTGLDAGADDYMVKPFAFAELLARLRALVRRGTVGRPAVVEVGDLRLDPGTHQVWRGGTEIELSAKEFSLLEIFMRHPGLVLSRRQLLEQAWEYDFEGRSNVVEVYIRYLRKKIDLPFDRVSIETVRGAGYRLRRDGGR